MKKNKKKLTLGKKVVSKLDTTAMEQVKGGIIVKPSIVIDSCVTICKRSEDIICETLTINPTTEHGTIKP